jgi:CRP-like cAMP-binding protein
MISALILRHAEPLSSIVETRSNLAEVICRPFETIGRPTRIASVRYVVCNLSDIGSRLSDVNRDSSAAVPNVDPRSNYLLRGLSDDEYGRLSPTLEPVHLPRPTELEAANEPVKSVYFPVSGVASIVAIDEGGESVDTAMVGREGMTGLAVFLGTDQSPLRTIVQVPLIAVRMDADALREEIVRGGTLVRLLQRHAQVVMITMAQLILCNRIHRLDQRAARWLLQVDDRVDERPFGVTQEFLAQMIGVQRPALSVAMRQFKDDGLVLYSRGQISIADHDGLAARSCSCISVIASEARRLELLEEAAADGDGT